MRCIPSIRAGVGGAGALRRAQVVVLVTALRAHSIEPGRVPSPICRGVLGVPEGYAWLHNGDQPVDAPDINQAIAFAIDQDGAPSGLERAEPQVVEDVM